MLENDRPSARESSGEDAFSEEVGQSDPLLAESIPDRSLSDDIDALIDDGKTYVEAELAFQKTRLSYVADNGKSGIGFVLGAFAFLHLALIGLVVGAVLSLAPLIGPAWATSAVVGGLLLGVVIFGLAAKKRFSKAADAFQDDRL